MLLVSFKLAFCCYHPLILQSRTASPYEADLTIPAHPDLPRLCSSQECLTFTERIQQEYQVSTVPSMQLTPSCSNSIARGRIATVCRLHANTLMGTAIFVVASTHSRMPCHTSTVDRSLAFACKLYARCKGSFQLSLASVSSSRAARP